jgi:hypothetical protein
MTTEAGGPVYMFPSVWAVRPHEFTAETPDWRLKLGHDPETCEACLRERAEQEADPALD